MRVSEVLRQMVFAERDELRAEVKRLREQKEILALELGRQMAEVERLRAVSCP
jgi:hypothetical protein